MYGTDSEDTYHHMAYSQHYLDSFLVLCDRICNDGPILFSLLEGSAI